MWMYGPVIALRELINDVDEPYKYSDTRLQRVFLIAAQDVINRGNFTAFTIDLESMSITPDPTEGNDKNENFVSLTLLKAVCIIANAESKKAAGSAIYIKDNSSAIDLRGINDGLVKYAEVSCKNYEEALFEYAATGTVGGVLISSPFRFFSSSDRVDCFPEYPRG